MKIENPKLKKIGGLRNFTKNSLLKIGIVVLVAALAGYLAGYTAQQSFRNLTGYNKTEVQATEDHELLETQNPLYEGDNQYVGAMVTVLQAINSGVVKAHNAFSESELLQAANSATSAIIYTALSPLFKAMDWAAFWFSFVLIFIVAAWLTNKLITLKSHVLSGTTDPQLIKNMEILEAKVKELVDNANKGGSKQSLG